jgi:hypothetical protein
MFSERPYTRDSITIITPYTLVATPETVLLYTVPADNDLFLRYISVKNGASAGGNFIFRFQIGAVSYELETTIGYALNTVYKIQPNIYLPTATLIQVRVTGGAIGNVITGYVFGETVPLQAWG